MLLKTKVVTNAIQKRMINKAMQIEKNKKLRKPYNNKEKTKTNCNRTLD